MGIWLCQSYGTVLAIEGLFGVLKVRSRRVADIFRLPSISALAQNGNARLHNNHSPFRSSRRHIPILDVFCG